MQLGNTQPMLQPMLGQGSTETLCELRDEVTKQAKYQRTPHRMGHRANVS